MSRPPPSPRAYLAPPLARPARGTSHRIAPEAFGVDPRPSRGWNVQPAPATWYKPVCCGAVSSRREHSARAREEHMKKSLLTAGLLLSLLAPAVSRQTANSPQTQQGTPDEDEVVKISTNLVQIDAVVTGGDGRQVTGLDASDFEILEDGRPQQITNFSYVSLAGLAPTAPPAPSKRKERDYIPPPPAALRPEQVRRTIALVVDDLGLSFESTVHVRQALRKFIDEQLQPNDLAAVIMTSAGSGS